MFQSSIFQFLNIGNSIKLMTYGIDKIIIYNVCASMLSNHTTDDHVLENASHRHRGNMMEINKIAHNRYSQYTEFLIIRDITPQIV
jgi:hypothetical protein